MSTEPANTMRAPLLACSQPRLAINMWELSLQVRMDSVTSPAAAQAICAMIITWIAATNEA